MRSSRITGLAMALLLGTAGAVMAQQPGTEERDKGPRPEREARRQGGFGLLLKDIELNAEQKTQLQNILGKREADEARGDAGSKVRDEVKSARERGDTAALRALRAQHVARMQQQREARLSEIRAILTPAQQQIFDRNVEAAKTRFDKRAGRRAM